MIPGNERSAAVWGAGAGAAIGAAAGGDDGAAIGRYLVAYLVQSPARERPPNHADTNAAGVILRRKEPSYSGDGGERGPLYGPSRSTAKWRWITWGSAFAAIGWIVLSALFSWYAANFGSYNQTYGSLGPVIGFMMWLWLSTIVVLFGAELDAEMEHQG